MQTGSFQSFYTHGEAEPDCIVAYELSNDPDPAGQPWPQLDYTVIDPARAGGDVTASLCDEDRERIEDAIYDHAREAAAMGLSKLAAMASEPRGER